MSTFCTILVTTSLSRYSASIGGVVQSSGPRSMRVGQTYRLSGSWMAVISVPQGWHLTSPARRWRYLISCVISYPSIGTLFK